MADNLLEVLNDLRLLEENEHKAVRVVPTDDGGIELVEGEGQKRVYLAGSLSPEKRENYIKAVEILRKKGFEVYAPYEQVIPHAWDYPNDEWGLMVFTNDVMAIDRADWTVMLSYGRMSTAGANWEAGYAFGKNKKVLIVEMSNEVMSLMVANGRWATVRGLEGLANYDFDAAPKERSDTEQK